MAVNSWVCAIVVSLHLISLFLFIPAFFPPKINPPSAAKLTSDASVLKNHESVPRLVVILIDALRADFPQRNGGARMPYVNGLLSKGRAVQYTANTQLPTVTLPRLKALTTGALSAFTDVLTNFFADSHTDTDNLIDILVKSGRNVVIHGDDTWMKLYGDRIRPRSDGTTSFFVSDYTEVDHNVTRHIDDELHQNDDWQLMVLHYLGLDHIGHSMGAQSDLIDVKLREMDGIIQRIHGECKNCALVALGDHGMTEAGTHGGSSGHERNVPLIFLAPSGAAVDFRMDTRQLDEVQQVDFVNTVCALFNVDPPIQSLGVVLYPVVLSLNEFVDSPSCRTLELLLDNGRKLVKACGDSCAHRDIDFIMTYNASFGCSTDDLDLLYRHVKSVQLDILTRSSGYDESRLAWVMSLVVMVAALSLYLLMSSNSGSSLTKHPVLVLVLFMHWTSAFGSSLVEEEHYIWLFILPTVLSMMAYSEVSHVFTIWRSVRNSPKSWNWTTCDGVFKLVSVAVVHRVCRHWISTGVKWQHLPSVVTVIKSFPPLNSALLVVSYAYFMVSGLMSSRRWYLKITVMIQTICLAMLHFYTGFFTVDQQQPLTAFTVPLAKFLLLTSLPCLTTSPSHGILVVALTLGRAEHLGLLILVDLLAKLTNRFIFESCRSRFDRAVLVYIFCQTAFFYTGNSNSISTIDVSRGYVPVSTYEPLVVAPLILFYGYIGPMMILANLRPSSHLIPQLAFLRIITLSAHLMCLFIHRHHLFVWSVFAPKLFYEVFHTGLMIFLVVVVTIWYCIRKIGD